VRNRQSRGRNPPSIERSPIARSSIVGRIGTIERDREERLPRRCFERTAPRRPRHLRAPTFTPGRRRSSIKVPNQSYISYIYLRFISLSSHSCSIAQRAELGARARLYDFPIIVARAIFALYTRNFRRATRRPRIVASQRVTQSRSRSGRFRTEGNSRRWRAPRPRDRCAYFFPCHATPRRVAPCIGLSG